DTNRVFGRTDYGPNSRRMAGRGVAAEDSRRAVFWWGDADLVARPDQRVTECSSTTRPGWRHHILRTITSLEIAVRCAARSTAGLALEHEPACTTPTRRLCACAGWNLRGSAPSGRSPL